MHFAIIDDDMVFSEDLKNRIAEFCNTHNFLFSIDIIPPDKPNILKENLNKYNVIFLDIEMPGISGFEISEKISKDRGRNSSPYIVFITSQDHLVFDALRKFPYAFVRKTKPDELEACLISLSQKLTDSPTYSIKDGRLIKSIEIKNIIRLEKSGNYTIFHTNEGTYQERANISDKQKELAKYHFLRPHSGAVVNADHIKEYQNDTILMSDGEYISVSRTFKKLFKADLHRWLKR